MAIKKEEKAKVGRPKLASPEIVKESWFNIGASLAVAFVMTACCVDSITGLGTVNPDKIAANATKVKKPVKVVIPARKQSKTIIKPNGDIIYVNPSSSK